MSADSWVNSQKGNGRERERESIEMETGVLAFRALAEQFRFIWMGLGEHRGTLHVNCF
jgi:hypothetical protein